MKKIAVALSGGIDSAATALLLYERGYRVTAVTFDLFGDAESLKATHRLAEKLKMPLIVEDLREEFEREVIGYFTAAYMRGETPAPCSYCNPRIKWNALLRVAERELIPYIATGHYVRVVTSGGKYYIARGVDPVKDQSYYLWDLEQEMLERAVLPLGDFTKTEVRELMNLFGFPELTTRKESMSVCFLGKGGYGEFLRQRLPDLDCLKGGMVVTREGRVVGSHRGYPFYTVGQKRGFELVEEGEFYVLEIDSRQNRLIVGALDQLYTDWLTVRSPRIIDPGEFFSTDRLRVKVRGVGVNPEGYARVEPAGEDIIVRIPAKAYAAAKGQPVVFYIDDRVVGGGYL